MSKVGRQGVVTMEESKTAEDSLSFVEGMQFDRGYYSPYFVTDPERMVCGWDLACSVLTNLAAVTAPLYQQQAQCIVSI